MSETSYPRHRIRITLLENPHPAAEAALEAQGYSVESIPRAVEGDELGDIMAASHIVGVRSRTKVREAHLERASKLLAIGCFSVGTDQVDLHAAACRGVPVFNAPHASTRSVAELTMGCVVALARRLGDKNTALHRGQWDKSLSGAHEVRGHTIGIVGYGHIGQQVGLLAEAFGMRVLFFDIVKKLALGLATPVSDLDTLLQQADVVTLHVPETAVTVGLIDADRVARMKRGSYLLNLSRGKVVAADALRAGLGSGHLAGAALDVYASEPTPQVAAFDAGFADLPNVILTPHVGGNTEEAQRNIGLEVAVSITQFIDRGSTEGAVNFPHINLPETPGSHRILNIHRNVPGVLAAVNQIVSDVGANIEAQQLATTREIGYLVMDINTEVSGEVSTRIAALPMNVRTRILY
ncbi:MAG: phosphoglycerate dehydrogenase [Acidobacteriota bacterium]|nr:phosphoglycerate dehydrogenase [Acidobacteriota bacterium]